MNAAVLAHVGNEPAPGGPGILDALRLATYSRHKKLAGSAAMARLFHPAYTLSEYRTHLGRLLGLFEPLERAVAKAGGHDHPVNALRRCPSLRDDLAMMGASPGDIAGLERCDSLPSIVSAGLGGYTYVILGSMLGGKIIVERLRVTLGLAASFHFYGDGHCRPEALWTPFCMDLERNGRQHVHTICATAVAIFDIYADWLAAPDRARPGSR